MQRPHPSKNASFCLEGSDTAAWQAAVRVVAGMLITSAGASGPVAGWRVVCCHTHALLGCVVLRRWLGMVCRCKSELAHCALQFDPRLYIFQDRLQIGAEARLAGLRYRVVGNVL